MCIRDSRTPVSVGDYARLYDADWPQTVQGWLLGRVIGVEPRADDQLRKRVTIQPLVPLDRVTSVTVLVPRSAPLGVLPERDSEP